MSQNPLEQFLEEGRQLRNRTLGVLDTFVSRAEVLELPSPEKALNDARLRLANDIYQLLIVGEVKRGKTTFVNALTGLKLPEAVDVATSQVFRIQHGNSISFYVRYEDETRKEIQASELGSYGSQVVIDAQGVLDPGKTIRWIEVTVPYPNFLPKNIVLLDTPGIGSVNISHEEITHRVLPYADAVIFVLDSERPIDNLEVKFLADILVRTRHMFFIQTKIDLRTEVEWQDIRAKSQVSLQQKFGNVLLDTTVWPLSSVLLQKAGDEKEYAEIRLIESRHREFSPALSSFLYRVIGWSRAADAVVLATDYCRNGGQLLADRHKSLVDESRHEAENYRNRLQQTKRTLEDKNSDFNRKRAQSFDLLRDEGRKAMHWMEDQFFKVERDFRDQIDQTPSVDAAKTLAESLAENITRQLTHSWREVQQNALDFYSAVLADLLIVAEKELRFTSRNNDLPMPIVPKFEGNVMERATVVRNHALSAAFMVGLPFPVLVTVGVLLPGVALALGAIAAGVATVVGVFSGVKAAGRSETNAFKAKLQQHLDMVLRPLRINFLRGVEEQFRTLERDLQEHIQQLTDKKRQEAEVELTRLQEQERMTQQQRADEAKKLDSQMAEWRKYGDECLAVAGQLTRLYERVAPRSSAPN